MKKTILQQIATPLILMVLFALAIFGVMLMNGNLKNPPKLEVDGATEITTTKDTYQISGKVDPKATLRIEGKRVTPEKDGSFKYTVKLKQGVQAVDLTTAKWYSTQSKKITITRSLIEPVVVAVTAPVTAPQSVASGTTEANGALSTSGPKENVFGAFGLACVAVGFMIYRKSVKYTQKGAYKPFTAS